MNGQTSMMNSTPSPNIKQWLSVDLLNQFVT